ncbi:MAG: NfeD family protein [Clostridiales bacterium]|nr:NfeD family protein [Clostridiales bacterium]
MASVYWLIAFVVLVGIEIATLALTTIWFAAGAFIAFLLSLFGLRVEVQLVAFVLVSFAMLFLTRPMSIRYINSNTVRTNADSLIGKEARVTVEVNNELGTGTAVVNGQEWTARSEESGVSYPVGATVKIRSIRGVKLIVEAASPTPQARE